MKNLLPLILSLCLISCNAQEPQDQSSGKINKSNYRFDYKGKEMTKEEQKAFFERELQAIDDAKNSEGNISIIADQEEIKALEDQYLAAQKFEINWDRFKGERFYWAKAQLCDPRASAKDFIKHYESFSKEERREIISHVINYDCDRLKQDRVLIDYFIAAYDEYIAQGDERNSLKGAKIAFLTEAKYPGYIDTVFQFFDNYQIEDASGFQQNLFLALIADGKTKEALNIFERLGHAYINHPKLNEQDQSTKIYSPIPTAPHVLDHFLYADDQEIRKEYLQIILKLYESPIWHRHTLLNGLTRIWLTNRLSDLQKKKVIQLLNGLKSRIEENDIQYFQLYAHLIYADYYGVDFLDRYEELVLSPEGQKYFPNRALNFLSKKEELNEAEKEKILTFTKTQINTFDGSEEERERLIASIQKNLYDRKDPIDMEAIKQDLIALDLYDDEFDEEKMKESQIKNGWSLHIKTLTTKDVIFYMMGGNLGDIGFDAEASQIPVPYTRLIQDFSDVLEKRTGMTIKAVQKNINYDPQKDNYQEISYEVYIFSNADKVYKVALENSGDWYYFPPVVDALNKVLADRNIPERFLPIDTGDQTAYYILMPPGSFKLLDDKYKINEY